MKKKPGKLWLCIFVLIAVFIAFIIVLGLTLISWQSVTYNSDTIDFNALNSANRKIQSEISYLTGSQIKTNDPRKVSFSAQEVNALLAMSITGAQTFNTGNKIFSDMVVNFDNGIFYFNASKNIKIYTPFGRYINLRCDFEFRLKDKTIDFKVLYLRIGKIVLPDFIVDYLVNRKKDAIYAVPAVQRLLQTVKEIAVSKNSIVIIYYPKNLMYELNGFLAGQT